MESVNSDIILVYFIGTVGMLLLAGGLVFFFVIYQKRILAKQLELNKIKHNQQKEILNNTISAQEKERKRIAQDLHDEVGAMLSVVKLNVARIERQSEDKPKVLASETKHYLDDVITQVRGISRSLLPPSLEKLGLLNAIEELANWVNKSDEIKVECWSNGTPSRFELSAELAIFRIVQELVNNAIKYSEGNRIFIGIRFRDDVAVLVRDNGKGFDLETKMNSGLGLKNLESRTEVIGAKFKMKSSPGNGTMAIVYWKKNGER